MASGCFDVCVPHSQRDRSRGHIWLVFLMDSCPTGAGPGLWGKHLGSLEQSPCPPASANPQGCGESTPPKDRQGRDLEPESARSRAPSPAEPPPSPDQGGACLPSWLSLSPASPPPAPACPGPTQCPPVVLTGESDWLANGQAGFGQVPTPDAAWPGRERLGAGRTVTASAWGGL